MENSELLEQIKNYIRVDYDEDDRLLITLIETAKEYILNTVGYIDLDKESFKVLLYVIVGELYEKRSYMVDKGMQANKTIKSLIAQLKLKGGN